MSPIGKQHTKPYGDETLADLNHYISSDRLENEQKPENDILAYKVAPLLFNKRKELKNEKRNGLLTHRNYEHPSLAYRS